MNRFDPIVVVPESPAVLAEHRQAWTRLHGRRLLDNAYAAPWFLEPLIRHAGDGQRVAFAYRGDPDGEMIAAWPVSDTFVGAGPLRTRITASSPLVLDGTPLVHRDHVHEAVAALTAWLDEHGDCTALTLNRTAIDDEGWQVVERALRECGRRPWFHTATRRPLLYQRPSFEAYLAELSSKRRSSWRAARRRADRAGELLPRVVRDETKVAGLARRFLELEQRGWKGEAGTALACQPGGAEFLQAMLHEAAARDRLLAVELTLDGEPLSVSLNLREGSRLFGFKTAYDAKHRNLAPGIQNLMEVIRTMHAVPGIELFDSGAGPRSFVRAYLPESRGLGEVQVASSSFTGEASALLLPAARRLLKRARGRTEAA